MSDIESLTDFAARTKEAKVEDFPEFVERQREAGRTPDEIAADFDRRKAFVLSNCDGVQPLRSFRDAAGRIVDCVPFDQQPTVRAARAAGWHVPPPPKPHNEPSSSRPAPCPEGSVPVTRVSLEQLLDYQSFDDYFRKGPPPAPVPR